MLLMSSARMNPAIVIVRAISFRWWGMVMCGTVMGGMLLVIRNPATMLPARSRLIGLISDGLFSLIRVNVEKRGCPNSAKKMIRALYMAVRDVAMRVISRAQAFVYDVFAVSMIRSFE